MKKNKYLYIIFLIVIGLLAIFASSYAFFAMDVSDTVGNYEVVFDDKYRFTVTGTQSDDITVSDFAMFGAGTQQVAASFTHDLTISLENLIDKSPVNCTYDYVWRWDTTKDGYKKSTGATFEYTIKGPFSEQNVPDYDAASFVLGSGSINLPSNEQKVTKQISITSTFYNLADIDQSVHANKSYKGGVIIDNIRCN